MPYGSFGDLEVWKKVYRFKLKRHYTVGSNSSLSLTAMCEEHGYWLLS